MSGCDAAKAVWFECGGRDSGENVKPCKVARVRTDLGVDDTQRPVSSNLGLLISPLSASRPTFPVPMWATRMAIGVSAYGVRLRYRTRAGRASCTTILEWSL
jgi:hypothetical protein